MSRRAHPPTMAAAVIRRNREGQEEILIGRIPVEPYEGRWTFPAGPVDDGEMPEPALRRALKSLLDTTVQIVYGQPPFDQVWDGVTCRWRYFFCDNAGHEVNNRHYDEVRWVNRGDLREYEFDPVSRQVVEWMLDAPR